MFQKKKTNTEGRTEITKPLFLFQDFANATERCLTKPMLYPFSFKQFGI